MANDRRQVIPGLLQGRELLVELFQVCVGPRLDQGHADLGSDRRHQTQVFAVPGAHGLGTALDLRGRTALAIMQLQHAQELALVNEGHQQPGGDACGLGPLGQIAIALDPQVVGHGIDVNRLLLADGGLEQGVVFELPDLAHEGADASVEIFMLEDDLAIAIPTGIDQTAAGLAGFAQLLHGNFEDFIHIEGLANRPRDQIDQTLLALLGGNGAVGLEQFVLSCLEVGHEALGKGARIRRHRLRCCGRAD